MKRAFPFLSFGDNRGFSMLTMAMGFSVTMVGGVITLSMLVNNRANLIERREVHTRAKEDMRMLVDYVKHAIKNRWCIETNANSDRGVLVNVNETPNFSVSPPNDPLDPEKCTPAHPGALERLTLSDATLREIKKNLAAHSTNIDKLGVETDSGKIERQTIRVDLPVAGVNLASLPYSVHPLKINIAYLQKLGVESVTINVTRTRPQNSSEFELSDALIKIRVDLNMPATGLQWTMNKFWANHPYTETGVVVIPRPLNKYAFVVDRALYLDGSDPTTGLPAECTQLQNSILEYERENSSNVDITFDGDALSISEAHQKMRENCWNIYFPGVTASAEERHLIPGIRFKSPVLVNNDIYLQGEVGSNPDGSPSDVKYVPVTFESSVHMGAGRVYTKAPNSSEPTLYTAGVDAFRDGRLLSDMGDSFGFGGFKGGLHLDVGKDLGLAELFGLKDPDIYLSCNNFNQRKTDLSKTASSRLLIQERSKANGTFQYRLALSDKNYFVPQTQIQPSAQLVPPPDTTGNDQAALFHSITTVPLHELSTVTLSGSAPLGSTSKYYSHPILKVKGWWRNSFSRTRSAAGLLAQGHPLFEGNMAAHQTLEYAMNVDDAANIRTRLDAVIQTRTQAQSSFDSLSRELFGRDNVTPFIGASPALPADAALCRQLESSRGRHIGICPNNRDVVRDYSDWQAWYIGVNGAYDPGYETYCIGSDYRFGIDFPVGDRPDAFYGRDCTRQGDPFYYLSDTEQRYQMQRWQCTSFSSMYYTEAGISDLSRRAEARRLAGEIEQYDSGLLSCANNMSKLVETYNRYLAARDKFQEAQATELALEEALRAYTNGGPKVIVETRPVSTSLDSSGNPNADQLSVTVRLQNYNVFPQQLQGEIHLEFEAFDLGYDLAGVNQREGSALPGPNPKAPVDPTRSVASQLENRHNSVAYRLCTGSGMGNRDANRIRYGTYRLNNSSSNIRSCDSNGATLMESTLSDGATITGTENLAMRIPNAPASPAEPLWIPFRSYNPADDDDGYVSTFNLSSEVPDVFRFAYLQDGFEGAGRIPNSRLNPARLEVDCVPNSELSNTELHGLAEFEDFSGSSDRVRQSWHFAPLFNQDTSLPVNHVIFSKNPRPTSEPDSLEIKSDGEFKAISIAQRCTIKKDVDLLAGYFVCNSLTLEPGRSTPLNVVGTMMVGTASFPPDAATHGVNFYSVTDERGLDLLKEKRILTKRDKSECDKVASKERPMWWSGNPNFQEYVDHLTCRGSGLLSIAHPFTWTTVSPECGKVTSASASRGSNFACKTAGRPKRQLAHEIYVEEGI